MKVFLLLLTGLIGASALQATEFSSRRLEIAREVMLYNETNWKQALRHYTDDLVYEDPILRVQGTEDMNVLMGNLFAHTRQQLTIEDEVFSGDRYMATWSIAMTYIYSGERTQDFVIRGSTLLRFNGKDEVVFHRDYYSDADILADIPVMGAVVKQFRKAHRETMLGE